MTWHEEHVVGRIIDQCHAANDGFIHARRNPREEYVDDWFRRALRELEQRQGSSGWDTREHIREAR